MILFHINQLFQADRLAWVMATLIVLVIITVSVFSKRYLDGDRYYRRQVVDIFLLSVCLLVMVFANHMLLLLIGLTLSNIFLVRLMVHKKEWHAARNSGRVALRTFAFGFIMLLSGIWILADVTGTASIHAILTQSNSLNTFAITIALSLIALASMTQSAIWPFHTWLISSLNSPTPVSALMHAGLVNGGGFLLVRFAQLFLTQPMLLKALFILGLITAVIGTFWKLLQTDIKRMLACSTMAQMGFMIAECGMGLFTFAVSHLIWHGLFKAYLFLATGSVIQEKRHKDMLGSVSLSSFMLACFIGTGGAFVFAQVVGIPVGFNNTGSLIIVFAFMASTQIACTLLEVFSVFKLFAAIVASLIAGGLYGGSVLLIEVVLAPLNLFQPQPLDEIYLIGFSIIFLIWLVMNMNTFIRLQNYTIWKWLYVVALNGSQPHPSTITSTRTDYQF